MVQNLRQKENEVNPYSKIAGIYDDIMTHVDYSKWARYIQKVIKNWHPDTKRILDISCGTASLLLKLNHKKYEMMGCDLSFHMLKIAKDKAIYHDIPLKLWQSNMLTVSLHTKVDTIICLYDSINYLLDRQLWKTLLDNTYQQLETDGLFIFDICTERNSIKYFQNYTERSSGYGYQYIRQSNYNKETKIHSNNFTIIFDSDRKKYQESHRQVILSINEVLNIIGKSDFFFIGAFDGLTFRSADENSLRIHFVLKKKKVNDTTF